MSEAPTGPGLPEWPLYGLAEDVRPAMAEAVAAGEAFALATLIDAQGGSPREPGTQMLIASNRLAGFLSGGCVEGDVVAHALEALTDGEPRRLVYGEGSPYQDIRLLCGARIEVFVETFEATDAAILGVLEARADRRSVSLWTDGRLRSLLQGDAVGPGAPGMFHVKHRYDPVPRVLVVGGDPTALAIAELSAWTDYETWLVRPKGPEVGPPLAGVRYDRRSASAALADIGLDVWTYVVVATHDLEADESALATALPSPAGYVGVLGARRRLPERLARLGGLGVSAAALARLRAPVGLDLGGKAPFEIATAVMAEIVAARRGSTRFDRSSRVG